MTHQGLGSHRYLVTFTGPGGHSWGAFGLLNPAQVMGRATHYFDLAADAYTRSGAKTSYNVGVVTGGTSVNSIPFEVSMQVDMRSESQELLMVIDTLFHRSIRRAVTEMNASRRSGPAVSVEIKMIGDRPSGEVAESDPLVRRAVARPTRTSRSPSEYRPSPSGAAEGEAAHMRPASGSSTRMDPGESNGRCSSSSPRRDWPPSVSLTLARLE